MDMGKTCMTGGECFWNWREPLIAGIIFKALEGSGFSEISLNDSAKP